MMLLDLLVKPQRTEVPDSELLDRYHRGDAEAFSVVYDRYSEGLYRYARSLCRDRGLSEDLVQEAFVRLLNHEAGRFEKSVQIFLFTILRNLFRDELRKSEVRRKNHPLMARKVSVDATEEEREESHRLQAALTGLNNLPEEQREVIVLKIYGGLTFSQIGTMLDAPTQTIASRYRYALEKLAKEIAID